MIWDPVKQFACLCKDGFVGERCEGNIHFNIYVYIYIYIKVFYKCLFH